MQSTGHSSMQALSSRSTQGSAITYVTAVLRGDGSARPSMPNVLEQGWLGRRVTVRRVLGRTEQGRTHYGDVVGDLVRLDAGVAVIDTRNGPVEVALDTIVIGKPAPPSTADELALQAAMASGWRAAETGQVGGWLLRATGGFTGRANSVLPLRAPGVPLEQALEQARAWYHERGPPVARRRAGRARLADPVRRTGHGRTPGPVARRRPIRRRRAVRRAPGRPLVRALPRRRRHERDRPGPADPARQRGVRVDPRRRPRPGDRARHGRRALGRDHRGRGRPSSAPFGTGYGRDGCAVALGPRARRRTQLPAGARRERGRDHDVRAAGLLGAPRLPLPDRPGRRRVAVA